MCDFCDKDYYIRKKFPLTYRETSGITGDSYEVTYGECTRYEKINARFCPECGRKL